MFKFLPKLMSCGSCGTNAPHAKEKCMACECPCEKHNEHAHATGGKKDEKDHESGGDEKGCHCC